MNGFCCVKLCLSLFLDKDLQYYALRTALIGTIREIWLESQHLLDGDAPLYPWDASVKRISGNNSPRLLLESLKTIEMIVIER